jgi:ATP-dependent Lhr-like helicase
MEGHWLRIDEPRREGDILAEDELIKDRIRQLSKRYGLLFRELLANELPPLQWASLFKSLRLMELSGEVLSGYFFKGIAGPQFISHEAFQMLQEPLPGDKVFWINAADPASLCGVSFEGKQSLPPRVPSTHLVYNGSRMVMVVKRFGKNIDIIADPDDPRLPDYFRFFKVLLNREFNPPSRITIELINGEPATGSAYAGPLKQFGFRSSRKVLELWREY